METFEVNLDNLSIEDKDALLALIEKANKPKVNSWIPGEHDTYYVLNPIGDINPIHGYHEYYTDKYVELGNCFRTQEKAEFAVERLKVIRELREFAERDSAPPNRAKYYLAYNHNIDKICIENFYNTVFSDIHFEKSEIAVRAIEAVGADRIKKYYFNIK